MQADLEARDERSAQLLERVSRNADKRLKQFPQAAEASANPLILSRSRRRIPLLAVGMGGKAHQHAEGVVWRQPDIRRKTEHILHRGETPGPLHSAHLPRQSELVVSILAFDRVYADPSRAVTDLHDAASTFAFPGHGTRPPSQLVWNFGLNSG